MSAITNPNKNKVASARIYVTKYDSPCQFKYSNPWTTNCNNKRHALKNHTAKGLIRDRIVNKQNIIMRYQIRKIVISINSIIT